MDNIYLGTNTEAVRQLQNRIQSDIRGYMSKKDIKIERNKVTYTRPETIQAEVRTSPTRTQLRKNYDELLAGKITDNEMKSKAVQYAELMIQPTTFCKLTMNTDTGETPELKVICCLPDHAQKMVSFWINKEVDSQTFAQYVEEFKGYMRTDRVANVIIEKVPKGKAKIKRVTPVFNFA